MTQMKTIQDLKAALLAVNWDRSESQNLIETHMEVSYNDGVIYGTMVCNNGLGRIFDCGVYTEIETTEFKHLIPAKKFITIEI